MTTSASTTAAPIAIIRVAITSTPQSVLPLATSGHRQGVPELIVDVTNSTPTIVVAGRASSGSAPLNASDAHVG
jgi:hypothetical protein